MVRDEASGVGPGSGLGTPVSGITQCMCNSAALWLLEMSWEKAQGKRTGRVQCSVLRSDWG